MKLNKYLVLKLLMFLIFPLFFLGTVNLYQIGKIRNDGSGTITISYSAKQSFLGPMKYTVGNFSFNEELARKNFESPNTTLKLAKLDYDIKDSTYIITIELEFKELNDLAEIPGFNYAIVDIEPSDSSDVFKYVLLKNSELYKYINGVTFIAEFESPVLSTNGTLEGNKVTWKNTINGKKSDPSNNLVYFANLKSNGSEGSGEKGKGCGLFGFELPFLVLGGLVLTYRRKKVI